MVGVPDTGLSRPDSSFGQGHYGGKTVCTHGVSPPRDMNRF